MYTRLKKSFRVHDQAAYLAFPRITIPYLLENPPPGLNLRLCGTLPKSTSQQPGICESAKTYFRLFGAPLEKPKASSSSSSSKVYPMVPWTTLSPKLWDERLQRLSSTRVEIWNGRRPPRSSILLQNCKPNCSFQTSLGKSLCCVRLPTTVPVSSFPR